MGRTGHTHEHRTMYRPGPAARQRAYRELTEDLRRLHAGGASESHALGTVRWNSRVKRLVDLADMTDEAARDLVLAIYRPARLLGSLRVFASARLRLRGTK